MSSTSEVVFTETKPSPSETHRRKVLWVNPVTLDTFLHQTFQLEITRHLAKRGHGIILLAIRSKDPVKSECPQVRIIFVPLRFMPILSNVAFTITLFFLLPVHIIISKPDFIIARPDVSILSFIPSIICAKSRGTKCVLDIRSTPVETVGFRGFQQKFWFAISVAIAKALFDGITTITPMMKKEICNTFNINTDKVGVWTSGVSTQLFDPASTSRAVLRRKLGLSDRFVVFYHGELTATRGIKEAIESIKILSRARPNVVLFLLGAGSAVPTLKNTIQNEGLQQFVIIHRPVDYRDVPKFIGASDVCIVPLPDHPYWRFQCPQKLLEYLAMGKVVIATDIPAHRAVIGDQKCGIYIASIKPDQIAESILFAIHNRDKLREWGKHGRTIVNEKYSWEKVAKDLESYLLSIDDEVEFGAKHGKN